MTDTIESILESSKSCKDKTQVRIVMVGPSEAKVLLSHNDDNNRRMKSKNYRKYAEYMKDGEFMLSNDALTIDEDGVLINGQNRLQAVLESGCTVPFIVVYGVQKETKNIINNGVIVTNKDREKMFLKEIGLDKKDAWGTICEILSADNGGIKQKQDFTMEVNTVKEFANENLSVLSDILNRDYVKKNRKGYAREHFGITNSTVAMRLEYMLTQRGDESTRALAKQFFDDINDMNRPKGSPIGLLQDWFTDDSRNDKYAGHGGESAEIAIMMAWDAYRKWKATGKSGIKFINVYHDKTDSNGNVVKDAVTGEPVPELNRDYMYLNYIRSHK